MTETKEKIQLPQKERMPKLKSNCKDDAKKLFNTGLSDFINVETIISTSRDQIAVAPGSLIDNGRRTTKLF